MNNNQPNAKKDTVLKRLLGMLFREYPIELVSVVVCILLSSISTTVPAIVLRNVIDIINKYVASKDWTQAWKYIWPYVLMLVITSIIGLVAVTTYTQIMARVTQGFLYSLRKQMFDHMQNLPIRYFDKYRTGDIMSHYTNDVDTIRELVSQSLPALVRTFSLIIFILVVMLRYSIWLTLTLMLGVVFMVLVIKKFGGGSAKFFVKQQKSLGKTEGFIQEMMNGQKVVKVFNHEDMVMDEFDKINDQLAMDSYKANTYANVLMPVIQNIGNITYVLVAVIGALFILFKIPNLSLTGEALTIGIAVSFLNMTKQFTGSVSQVSQQINLVVMAFAGGKRIFDLLDEPAEKDDGYVTLVNCSIGENGEIKEEKERTGKWAWKDILGDGNIEYTLLQGDVRFLDVDFEYDEGKPILHDINLYAKPGQKIAFVGATGAGKTTITNLINRFYDIKSGKIQYDHINVNRIKKSDLRRSLAVVLQETNLFTGTVMENIRYGRLNASDAECIDAAKLAGADSFIQRLPQGYDTMLSANGGNLSQGQRQLISIARAAVCNPPVMILDEATSSIDTYTEQIVQEGMDKLMKGRTVFVIAHRLSTVMDADVIMVLDHGKIIERGNHDELISQKGVYYQLYTGAFELE